jgi:uncharacterized membrane protein YhaH (DUF805 family)
MGRGLPFQKSGAGMGFVEAVKTGLSKYATFSGRATRPEYWYFVAFYALCNLICSVLDDILGTHFTFNARTGYFSTALWIVLFLPYLAVGFRRLHDTDHSGWWVVGLFLSFFVVALALSVMPTLGGLLAILCLLLILLLLFWYCQAGTPGANRYGPPPPTATNAALIVPE